MADIPRKDIKTAPVLRDAAASVKQASPLPPTDGASLDTFNTLVARDDGGAAAAAREVSERRNANRDAEQLPPVDETPGTSPQEQPTSFTGVQVSLDAPTPASGAAAAAGAAKDAARARLDPAISRDLTEDSKGTTTEAPSSLADSLNTSTAEMFERINEQSGGREAGMGNEQGASEPFRDSGRDALAAQVNDAFALADDSGTQGRTTGRMGTPADLGVSGDFGTKAGINANSGAGMDLFNVNLPNRGVSGAANDLGLMQGMLPGTGGAVGRIPSVAEGETELDGEPVTEIDGDPADTAEDAPDTGDTEMAAHEDGGWVDHAADFAAAANVLTRTFKVSYNATRGVIDGLKNFGVDVDEAVTELAVGFTENGQYAAEQETVADAVQGQAAANDARKAGVAPPSNPGREGSGIIGQPTAAEMAWRAAARERLGLGSPGSGDVDPTDEGNESVPSVGPEPGAMVFLQAGLANKATREFLFGQPVGPEAAAAGRGSIDFGGLPGDMGNIDYGPDSTGPWSGSTMTENEGDALNSLGGSGLSISDANRSDEDEDDTDDDAS